MFRYEKRRHQNEQGDGSKPSQNKTFKELAQEFIRQGEIRNLSEWTIKSYRYHDFAGNDFMCKDIGLDLVEKYILYMKKDKGLSNTVTLNSYIRNTSPIIKYGISKRYILNDF